MGTQTNGPLQSLDQWDDDVRARYRADRKKEEFRVYDDSTPQVVRDFYKQFYPGNELHADVDIHLKALAELPAHCERLFA